MPHDSYDPTNQPPHLAAERHALWEALGRHEKHVQDIVAHYFDSLRGTVQNYLPPQELAGKKSEWLAYCKKRRQDVEHALGEGMDDLRRRLAKLLDEASKPAPPPSSAPQTPCTPSDPLAPF